MLELFRRISIPHFAEHKLRTVLTVLGLALGAATAVGLDTTFQPIHDSLRHSAERLAGRAVIRVANGDAGVPEELLDEIRSIPGVDVAAACIQGNLGIADRKGEQLYVFGIDLLEDQKIRDYDFSGQEKSGGESKLGDPLVFLAKADSIALSKNFLKVLRAKIGDQIDVSVPAGIKRLTIRGSLDANTGPASLFAGRIALMDVFAAQKLLQLDHRFSQIDVSVKRGVAVDSIQAAIAKVVNGRGLVVPENRNLEQLEFTIRMTETAILGASSVANLLAMYIVFNTMLIAVAQRRREIGLLRAAGARRRTVIGMTLFDAALYAIVGAPIGVLLGIGLAKFFSSYLFPMLGTTYAPATPPSVVAQWNQMAPQVMNSLIAAALAALIPALEAARVHPIEAVRRSVPARTTQVRVYWMLAVAGVIVLVVGEFVSFFFPQKFFGDPAAFMGFQFGASYGALFIAICLIAPLLIRLTAIAIEPLLRTALASLGALASRSIVSNMRRFSLTGTAFVVSVMMAVFMSGVWSTTKSDGDRIADSMFGGMDIVVTSSPNFDKHGGKPLPGSLADQIGQISGVSAVASVRITDFPFGWHESELVAVDSLPGRPGFTLTSGNQREAVNEFVAGRGIVVDDAFAHMHDVHIGKLFSFATPRGELRLPILGTAVIMPSISGGADSIYISRRLYRNYWRDDNVSMIGPVLAPGAKRDAVMDEIRSRFGAQNQVFVSSVGDFRKAVEQTLQREVAPLIPIFVFATVIALFGLVNSLLASVLDRTREIGILRALGSTRTQVARLILYEATALGVIGTLLAIPAGFSMNYLNAIQIHFFMGSQNPFKSAGPLVLGALIAATISLAALGGYIPGRRAASVAITEAMQSE
jgi:putative ABC transport system permease protein